MVAAARKYNRVVQVNTQRRSNPLYLEARDKYLRSGRLGKIGLVETYSYLGIEGWSAGPVPDAPVPAYRQIADALRRHLVNGALQPGDRLPPVRQLALDLNVHFTTVAQAYRTLADEGWIDLKRRRGALVVERQRPRAPDTSRVAALTGRLHDIAAELRSLGLSRAEVASVLRRAAGLSKG